jgi:hypothetical protein
VIFEDPLVAQQNAGNKCEAFVCTRCLRFLGSVEVQVEHILSNRSPGGSANGNLRLLAPLSCADTICCFSGSFFVFFFFSFLLLFLFFALQLIFQVICAGCADPAILESLALKENRLPFSNRFPLPTPVSHIDCVAAGNSVCSAWQSFF